MNLYVIRYRDRDFPSDTWEWEGATLDNKSHDITTEALLREQRGILPTAYFETMEAATAARDALNGDNNNDNYIHEVLELTVIEGRVIP